MLSATSFAHVHNSLLDDFEGIAPFINTAKALEMTKEPWARDGSDFSDRIWKSKQGLLGNLNKDIVQGVIRGDSYDKLTKKMAQELNASEHAAGRLLMTESTAFSTMAQKETFKGLDVEMIEIVETIDSHTCAECASMNGRVMKLKDVEAGVTAPPFHPWCRGCICPYVEDDESVGEDLVRNIELDDVLFDAEGYGVDKEVAKTIYDGIQKMIVEDRLPIDFCFKDIATKSVAMQTQPGKYKTIEIFANKNFFNRASKESLNMKIKLSDLTSARNIEELVLHEEGHALLIQDKSIGEIKELYKHLEKIEPIIIGGETFIDGAEVIAETHILVKTNRSVPDEALKLYNKYLGE